MATLKIYNQIATEEEKAMLYCLGGIDSVCFKDVDEFVGSIAANDDTIDLRLHCNGGVVSEGWAIVDKLRATGKRITATIEGSCASMASVILLAASERKAYPHASLLIHKPYFPEYTLYEAYRADELEALAASLRDDERKMLDFYVERTGADRGELEALMDEDKFIDMERARELGFIQEIIPAASASARPRISAKAAAWRQRKTITNNQTSMAKQATHGEDKSALRRALAALASALGLEAPAAVSYELNTSSGDTITIDKPEGEDPAVGDKASPDGEHKMPDGTTIVIEDGVITEIREEEDPAANPDDETAAALEAANTRIAELEADLEEARSNAKTDRDKRILNLVAIAGGESWLAKAKSEYRPAVRQQPGSTGRSGGSQATSNVQRRIAALEAARKKTE